MCDGSASSEFCGEETFKRLLLRFKHIRQSYYRMKAIAYTLIHVRRFCST